jgi:hypothetical protein
MMPVMLSLSCRPGLPPSLHAFSERSEQFSAAVEGTLSDSFVLGELSLTGRLMEQTGDSSCPLRNEEYRIALHGRPLATVRCRASRDCLAYEQGCRDTVIQCHGGRLRDLWLSYSEYHFDRGYIRTAAGSYAVMLEQSPTLNLFRVRPGRLHPESNQPIPFSGAEPVAAVVHQPFRNTILLARSAPEHDTLLAASVLLMGIADRVRFDVRWRDRCKLKNPLL